MMQSLSEQKKQLRQESRNKIALLSATSRAQGSTRACALLQEQLIWKNAQSIFLYFPLPDELNIWTLVPEALRSGKIVLLPKFDPETNNYLPHQIENIESDLSEGKFGIHEPNGKCKPYSAKQLDLILVPALAFDPFGGRLGRGRGFYDRILARISGVKCGVAFDEQIVSKIPSEPHDVPVDCLLTPARWIVVSDKKSE